jgi:predicted nucleic acid-binding protein
MLARERAEGLTLEQRRRAWDVFDRNVLEDIIELVPMSPAIFKRANRIMEVCHPNLPLRSLDALHLASADQMHNWPLVTHDKRMRDAAVRLGFPVSPWPS